MAAIMVCLLLAAFSVVEGRDLRATRQAWETIVMPTAIAGLDASNDDTCGPVLSIETPTCDVIRKGEGYEIRKFRAGQFWTYATVTNSSYDDALRTGFLACYHFISGENSRKETIEMTAPVRIRPMKDGSSFKIGFFVPKKFHSTSELPQPLDPSLSFEPFDGAPKAIFGPIGGFPGEATFEAKLGELKAALERDGIEYDPDTVNFAGYSSPFQIFNRIQEVWVDVKLP